MPAGGSWHLGNAHIEITKDVKIGGVDVEAGKHALKARKTKKGWELVLDPPSRYNAKISDEGQALETEFSGKSTLYEHLSIDIQPSGDKSATKMYLDVRFDELFARRSARGPTARSATVRRVTNGSPHHRP